MGLGVRGLNFLNYSLLYNTMSDSQVISFKAPKEMVGEVDEAVKQGNYTSRGEFLRALLRNVEEKKLSNKAKKDISEARKQEGKPLNELL